VTGAGHGAIVRDEVIGPVLAVIHFDAEDEAIELANDTPYGLAAPAWTRDVYRALRATSAIRAGCVPVNDHIPIISDDPTPGMKESGFGKDMSTNSFDEVHDGQARHVRPHRRCAEALASNRSRGGSGRAGVEDNRGSRITGG